MTPVDDTAANRAIFDAMFNAMFFAGNVAVFETTESVVFWAMYTGVYENVADSAFPGVVPGAVDTDTTNRTLQDFLRESVFGRYEVLQELVGG